VPRTPPLGLDSLPYFTATMSVLNEVYQAAKNEAEAHGLSPRRYPARAHAWATAVLRYYGYTYPQRPDIISGYRSPAEQAKLLRRWNRGDREGLVAKPACQSWHMVGRAIDVESDVEGFNAYAYLLAEHTGARDGRTFGDRGHFDWPQAEKPPNICQQYR